jgi:hypothetical protein
MTQPADQLRGFRRNTQLYAAWWLAHGEAHPDEHPVITERLTEWRIAAAEQRQGEELQSCAREILTEAAGQRAREQRERLGRSAWQVVSASEPAGSTVPAEPAGEVGGGGMVEELSEQGDVLSRTRLHLQRVCDECGTTFPARHADARFCSQRCQKRARRAAA